MNDIYQLSANVIVQAYRAGIFPMAQSSDDPDIFWVSPEKRGIIPLDGFHISKSLKKAIKNSNFEIKIDNDFAAIIHSCANFGTARETTWINPTIISLYSELFEQKICHTVEVYQNEKLVGGLYGLSIGGAFFGESMFHTATNASKVALACLVRRLQIGGYILLDTQFITDHLVSMGGIEISRDDYLSRLDNALKTDANFYRSAGGRILLDCLQSSSQTS